MGIYTIKNNNEYITNFITNLLDLERIPYKLKPIKQQFLFEPSITIGYDIELHTDFQHYEYFIRLLQNEQSKCDMHQVKMPSHIQVQPFTPFTMLMLMSLPSLTNNKKKEKKSILKKIIDWIKNVR